MQAMIMNLKDQFLAEVFPPAACRPGAPDAEGVREAMQQTTHLYYR